MKSRVTWFANLVVPFLTALTIVMLEAPLTRWAKERESVLPVSVAILLGALLHPRFRHQLVSTLCYGVAILAARDALNTSVYLPPALDYEGAIRIRSLCLFCVAILAATAAVGETIKPGTVWARRCYFIASALYFCGIGAINLITKPTWVSALLAATGVIAIVGAIYSNRIIASEEDEAEERESAEEAEAEQRARAELRREKILAKEWRDTSSSPGV